MRAEGPSFPGALVGATEWAKNNVVPWYSIERADFKDFMQMQKEEIALIDSLAKGRS